MRSLLFIKSLLIIFIILVAVDSLQGEERKMDDPFKPLIQRDSFFSLEVNLGEKLFNDKNLSRDNSISCTHCHNLDKGGGDRKRFSRGIGGLVGHLHTPTVFNSSLNFKYFWDGRANSLKELVELHVADIYIMGGNWRDIVDRVKNDNEYRGLFRKVYAGKISKETISTAVSIFLKSLITPNSKFDKYLKGEISLSEKEEKGYQLFISYGCVACHQGEGLGGNMFQVFGVMHDYYEGKKDDIHPANFGLYNVTGSEEDKFMYKVPSLRNVEVTAPYFHDGSALTLEESVQQMSHYQLGIDLGEEETSQIVDFLKTLTGKYKGKKLK